MSDVKIYTRKGDDGTTGLWYGGRVPKNDLRTSSYGDVDEAISAIAVARSLARESEAVSPVHADLLELQRCMFIGCASLATLPAHHGKLEDGVTRLTAEMVTAVEKRIDWYKEHVELPPKFIIPGGTTLSAQLDVARTVTRRAERAVVALKFEGGPPGTEAAETTSAESHPAESQPAEDVVLQYLNRASDLLFVIARYTDEPDPQIFQGRG